MRVSCFPALAGTLFAVSAILPPIAFANSDALGAQCVNQSPQTKFYRRLAEIYSMAEPLVGVSEISLQEARSIAHFKMAYDECGRLVDIRYFQGKTPKPIDENFSANRFVPASRLQIERRASSAIYRFFDNAGMRKPVFENALSVSMHYDQDGRLKNARLLDANEQLVNSSLGYAELRWRWVDTNTAVETRHDATGNVVEGGGEYPFREATIAFTKGGFAKIISPLDSNQHIHIERNENHTRNVTFALDDDGEPVRAGAADIARIEYAYNANGYLVRAKYLSESGAPLVARSGHMGFERVYNETGNRLAYNFLNEHDAIWIPPDRGYAGQRFHWREDGVVRDRSDYVDASGEIINHPDRNYASILYEFDERNLVTKQIYLDVDGNIVAEE